MIIRYNLVFSAFLAVRCENIKCWFISILAKKFRASRIHRNMLRRQDDCPGHPWGRWSLPSTFSVMIGAYFLTTFPFLCGVSIANIYFWVKHYGDVIVGAMASQITSLAIVYSTFYSCTDQGNIKSPRHWPLCREFTGDRWIPAQMASNAENVSIWWRHHGCVRYGLPDTAYSRLSNNVKEGISTKSRSVRHI